MCVMPLPAQEYVVVHEFCHFAHPNHSLAFWAAVARVMPVSYTHLPGWEPERMAKLDELFKAYAPVTKEKLWENLKYFLAWICSIC